MRTFDPRSIALPGQSLADLYPTLYEQAVRCPKYPQLPLARLVPQSNLMLVWRCRCGNETLRKVNNVVNRGRVLCDRCQSTGKSRLEYEIAELLRVGLGAEVLTHHGPRRADQVDLYLPAYDTAVEIDPYRTHRDRVDKDRRRLEQHARRYARVFRVREERLPVIDGCPTVPTRGHPLRWARTIADEVAASDWTEPTPDEVRIAVETGAAAYFDLIQTPPSRSLAERPEIARDFVRNLDVPDQSPEWISVGSGALCLWSCPNGHPDYQAPVDRRTGPQATGCPICGRERAVEARRRPPKGGSAADLRPEIVAFFVENLSSPDRDLTQLRPGSHDQCRWRCARPACANTFEDSVKGRAARLGAVCLECRSHRVWETRRANPEDPANQHWQAALRALDEHIALEGDARIRATAQSSDGFRLGAWVLQTRKRRDSLTPSQLRDLTDRPEWVWSAKNDAWWRTFALMQQFAERERHTRVPARHEEGGVRLDLFAAKQRQRFDRQILSSDRIRAMESLPEWVWRSRPRRSDAGQRRKGP